MKKHHNKKSTKKPMVSRSSERRFIGLDVTVRGATFGAPHTGVMHAVFERIAMVTDQNGVQQVLACYERGRSVELNDRASVALASTYVAAAQALVDLHGAGLGLDDDA